MRRALIALVISVLFVSGCKRSTPVSNEVVSLKVGALPAAATDGAWAQAPEHVAKLLMQDLVEPRLMKSSTPDVRVRSVNNGSEIAFQLTWADPVVNDLPGPSRFLDGCAVQIPKVREPNPPDPQMGQSTKPVEIAFWRADWQASVNGRKDTITSLYPNASIDHYPFEAKSLEAGSAAQKEMATRYAPAQAVGNRRVGPRETPVEDMIAEGPGTLSPNPGFGSRGKGERTANGWSVVIIRKMPAGLAPKERTQVAFAVWEGSKEETGARKMRTGWIPLSVQEAQ